MKLYPFSLKELPDIQKKIFRRAHGIQSDIIANGETTIEFVIPYSWIKITTVEIIGLPKMMKADVSVHADDLGNFKTSLENEISTGIPKLKLNQFGFNVNVTKDYFRDHSEYDADLFENMIIRIVIKNDSDLTAIIGINFTLHEVV